jgi:hypothetical protein
MKRRKSKKGGTDFNFIDVNVALTINGHTINSKRTIYKTTRSTGICTMNELARWLYMTERQHFPSRTHTPDILKKFEGLIHYEDGETAESLFDKYWINFNETAQEQFEKWNKADDSEHAIFKAENDYLKFILTNEINGFLRLPLQIKLGFVYWLIKYGSGSIDELKKDYDQCPQVVKEWIDQSVEEAKSSKNE